MCTVWTSDCLNGTDTRRHCSTFPIGMEEVSRALLDMLGDFHHCVCVCVCLVSCQYAWSCLPPDPELDACLQNSFLFLILSVYDLPSVTIIRHLLNLSHPYICTFSLSLFLSLHFSPLTYTHTNLHILSSSLISSLSVPFFFPQY